MKIRERSMALLLALMMVLGLTACGKKAVEAEPYNGIVYVGAVSYTHLTLPTN